MKNFLTFFLAFYILTVANLAAAHDTDREDQLRVKHLNLDNDEFFELWVAYWHERRELVNDMVEYAQCVGAIDGIYRVSGFGRFTGADQNILGYWNVIPAIPLETYPKDPDNARVHIEAAKITRSIFGSHIIACQNYLEYLVNSAE